MFKFFMSDEYSERYRNVFDRDWPGVRVLNEVRERWEINVLYTPMSPSNFLERVVYFFRRRDEHAKLSKRIAHPEPGEIVWRVGEAIGLF